MWASAVAAPRLQSTGSIVMIPGPSCSMACGIIPDQGLNPMSPTLAGEFFRAEQPCLGSNPGSVLTGCVTLGELLIYLV